LQNKYGFKDLYKEGEFWYAIKWYAKNGYECKW
jgi:hypothetical protein